MYFLKQRYANQLKFRSGVFHLPLTATGPLSLTGLVIRSLQQTHERQTHGTELRIRRVSPCFVEAASAKGDLFSEDNYENRPIKTKPNRLFFATG